ncbi:hypothetical protein [Streptomyces cinereoruber]
MPEAAEHLRRQARALAEEVLAWQVDGENVPSLDQATAAVERLDAYGEQLRKAVRAGMSPGSPETARPILREAHNRLGLPLTSPVPPFVLTAGAVVRHAQNFARLIAGLLSAVDTAPAGPPAPGDTTTPMIGCLRNPGAGLSAHCLEPPDAQVGQRHVPRQVLSGPASLGGTARAFLGGEPVLP